MDVGRLGPEAASYRVGSVHVIIVARWPVAKPKYIVGGRTCWNLPLTWRQSQPD